MTGGTDGGYGYWFARLRNYIPLGSVSEQRLLILAGLPLIDGVFVGALTGNGLSSPVAAATFGISIFSGAGCLAAALALPGSIWCRLRSALYVYGMLLPAVLACAVLSPVFQQVLLPDFAPFSALILMGVAAELAGLCIVPTEPRAEPLVQRWKWSLRLVAAPQVVLAIAFAISLLHLLRDWHGLSLRVSAMGPIEHSLLAILAGALQTLVGAAVGGAIAPWFNLVLIRRFGALSLFFIALHILGAPIAGWIPVAVLAVGLLTNIGRTNLTRERTVTPTPSTTSPSRPLERLPTGLHRRGRGSDRLEEADRLVRDQ